MRKENRSNYKKNKIYYEKHRCVVVFKNLTVKQYGYKKYGKYTEKIAKLAYELDYPILNYFQFKNNYIKWFLFRNDNEKPLYMYTDLEDFDILKEYCWFPHKDKNTYYAITTIMDGEKQTSLSVHKLLMKPNKNKMVDHIDRNGLNNRKNNLRIVNNSENQRNSRVYKNNKFGVSGVHEKKNKEGKVVSIVCMWNEKIGKRNSKTFSINKYGYDKAVEMAIKLRKEKEKLYYTNIIDD